MQQSERSLSLPNGRVTIDPRTGALAALHLDPPRTDFIQRSAGAGLVRIAVPLDHYQSHFLEVGRHGAPEISGDGDTIRLRYEGLTSDEGTFPIAVEITLRGSDNGLVVSATVDNNWTDPLPQIFFPQILGLEAVGGVDQTRVQLGRCRIEPFRELSMRPDDARWLDRPLHVYKPYADFEFNMKWLDYGDQNQGLTLYSRNTRHTVQGILVQREDRAVDRVHLRWAHYPYLPPGERWESGEYVLLPHAGDWYAGARAYQAFTSVHYPYNAPRRIREALAIRSIWCAPRNAPPNFRFSELPNYAAEIADSDLGITEMVVWHWWYRNGYPIFVDARLGTEDDLRAALAECAALGVPIVLFVSHHILRDNEETDPDWVHLNAGHQRVINNWTYGRDFLPVFRPPHSGTHKMVNGSALSPKWRETGLAHYKHFLGLGGKGICFDVGRSWGEPNFNPAIDGPMDEEGEKLQDFARAARELIYEVAPDGTYSAEHVSDVNVPVVDYTWEWYNSGDHVAAAPFRYVFPHFRLNANVNEHPRGSLIGFMEGALINVIPGNMHVYRLRDCPELTTILRQLTKLRRRFLPFFTEGQFRFREGLTVNGGDARVYTHGDRIVVIAINPSDERAEVTISVDPEAWGGAVVSGSLTVHDLDDRQVEQSDNERSAFQRSARIEADSLRIFAFTAAE